MWNKVSKEVRNSFDVCGTKTVDAAKIPCLRNGNINPSVLDSRIDEDIDV